MSYRKVDDTSLASVADAIRAKGGTSDEFVFPDGFVSAIGSIQTGGGTESGLPSSADVTFGYVKKTETVTEKAPEGKCWYNGLLLPEIPADVLAEYPYVFIGLVQSTGKYQILASTQTMYFASNGYITRQNGNSEPFLYCVAGDSCWTVGTSGNYGWNITSDRTLMWSNHDIPNGSATATEIYFEGSEPLTELTETVTKLVPVERESEYAVTSANLNDIAKRTQEMAGTTKLMTPEEIIYFLNSVKFIPQSTATSEFSAQFDFSPCTAVGKIPLYQKGTAESTFTLPTGMFSSIAVGELTE